MTRIIPLLIFGAIFITLDIYVYYFFKTLWHHQKSYKWLSQAYILMSVFSYYALGHTFLYFAVGDQIRTPWMNFLLGFMMTMFFIKLTIGGLALIEDVVRIIWALGRRMAQMWQENSTYDTPLMPERRMFIAQFGAAMASLSFTGMLYGITKGKYKYTTEKLTLIYPDLPKEFDGLKVVQISDIHAGSFDSADRVAEGIDIINGLNPDIICFTGDLVNSEKEEIDPYIEIFSRLKATYGKFAVLGNHDYYGTYNREDGQAEKAYFEDFYKKYNQMGFRLLNNASHTITKNEDKLDIIGVENWGKGKWFPKKGDLDIALSQSSTADFKLLMSHDPTHWDEIVLPHDQKIHLTLSGHTHGFQFGIKIPGLQWSPAKYRYKRWMGLYEQGDEKLYVNRGFGFLGFPGRVGMWPEITCIELKRTA